MSLPWRCDFASTPPFAHLSHWVRQLAGPDWPTLGRLDELAEQARLANAHDLPVRFRTQHQRCGQREYEAGILTTGIVPTRAQLARPAQRPGLAGLSTDKSRPQRPALPASGAGRAARPRVGRRHPV